MTYFSRWDIVEAHYWHAVLWHGGQTSDLYKKQCRISRYYNPGAFHRGYESLSENAREIYGQLVARDHGRDVSVCWPCGSIVPGREVCPDCGSVSIAHYFYQES